MTVLLLIVLMDFIFSKLIVCFGQDKAAYIGWGTASVFWVFGFIYVSEHKIDSYASNLSRATLLILFNLYASLKSDYKKISASSIMYMIWRHILLVTFGFVFAQSFFYLPINLVHTLSTSGPVYVLLIDYFLYKIEISRKQVIGVIIAVTGMALAVNGDLIQLALNPGQDFHTDFQGYKPQAFSPYFQILAGCVLLLAQFCWAYSIVLVKKVQNANHYQINFQYGVIMILFAGCLYPNTTLNTQLRLSSYLKSLVFQGLPLAIGQALFSHSMLLTKNLGVMTMTGFLTVVMGYIVKIFRYNQTLNWVCLIGSLMIMLGISRIVLKQ